MTAEPIAWQTEPTSWQGSELAAGDGLVTFGSGAAEEIRRLAETLSANPLPVLALDPLDFDLPECRAVMAEARAALSDGPGFVIIDRLLLRLLGREGLNIRSCSVRGVEANGLVEFLERSVLVILVAIGKAPAVVGMRVAGIELDRLVVILDRPVILPF